MSRSYNHDHALASVDHVNKLAHRVATAYASHERQRLLTVAAGTLSRRVPAMPLDLGIEQLADHLEVAAHHGLESAPSDLHIRLRHD
jgi:hypothetical protein